MLPETGARPGRLHLRGAVEAAFERSLTFVLAREGGYANHPQDRGGPTSQGISLAAVEHLRDPVSERLIFDFDADGDVDALDIQSVPKHQAARDQFYRERYWEPTGCDELWWPLCLLVFDVAVNSGVHAAARNLQRALLTSGCWQPITGVVGHITRSNARRVEDRAALVESFLAIRERFYHAVVARNPSQRAFLAGWLNRVAALRAATKEA